MNVITLLAGLVVGFFACRTALFYISFYNGTKSFEKLQRVVIQNSPSTESQDSSFLEPFTYSPTDMHESPLLKGLSSSPNVHVSADFETGFAWTPDRRSTSFSEHVSGDIPLQDISSSPMTTNRVMNAKQKMRTGLENIRKKKQGIDNDTSNLPSSYQQSNSHLDDFAYNENDNNNMSDYNGDNEDDDRSDFYGEENPNTESNIHINHLQPINPLKSVSDDQK
jgi:hypothetical protein